MASALYPSFKALLLSGGIDLTTADIRAIIVDSADYTYSAAHDFLDDVTAGARVAVSSSLASKTVAGGVFDAADVTYSAVTGDSVEAIILYKHTGTDATSNLVAYIDGVSVTPNGGNIVVSWNASGIFAL
ncbi:MULTISPECIES: hypothetical protein [unclassified Streptomyces]|uniref:hypothetical protein n=1 Tax=unclassified Streptomyces TaxID=2593676 RepID=UPI0029BBB015|nr:hypothetical protein [Streptomyces sp. PA03-2a]MDX2732868.1 hypothetical protein [Streptomyces sp. PA03-2a]